MFEESVQRAFLAVAIVFSITVLIALFDPRTSRSATPLSEDRIPADSVVAGPPPPPPTVEFFAEPAAEPEADGDQPGAVDVAGDPIGATIDWHEERSGMSLRAPMDGCEATAVNLPPDEIATRFRCEPGDVRPAAPGQVILVVREPLIEDERPQEVADDWTWARGLSMGPFIVVDHGPQSTVGSAISVYSGLTEVNEFMSPGRQVDFDTVLGTNAPAAEAPDPLADLGFELWVDDVAHERGQSPLAVPTFETALGHAEQLATLIVAPSDNTCPFPGGTTNNLPNAPRTYRSGTHQGVDFNCAEPGHSATAVADGRVVMIVNDFKDPAPGARNATLANAAAAGTTPHWILAMLYGNFVVVDHGPIDGVGQVTTIYAHLRRVDNGIRLGGLVARGQRLGEVGNTGTSTAAAELTDQEPGSIHLHWELFVDGVYLGRDLSGPETEQVYATLLCPTGTALFGC